MTRRKVAEERGSPLGSNGFTGERSPRGWQWVNVVVQEPLGLKRLQLAIHILQIPLDNMNTLQMLQS